MRIEDQCLYQVSYTVPYMCIKTTMDYGVEESPNLEGRWITLHTFPVNIVDGLRMKARLKPATMLSKKQNYESTVRRGCFDPPFYFLRSVNTVVFHGTCLLKSETASKSEQNLRTEEILVWCFTSTCSPLFTLKFVATLFLACIRLQYICSCTYEVFNTKQI